MEKFTGQKYNRGIPEEPVKQIGTCKPEETGTTTKFRFDTQIFKGEGLDFSFSTLIQRFREMAFVTRGVRIHILDERTFREMTFYFEGGITSFVRYLNRNREGLHPIVYAEKELEHVGVEVAIQYTDAYLRISIFFCEHD